MDSNFDLFISYAVENKNEIVEPLAMGLKQVGLKVWYAGAELSVGDSIVDAINHGLNRSKFGLVILSPIYLQKQWTMAELKALFAQEIAKKDKHILPVWHQLDQEYLRKSCPLLIDKLGLSSNQPLSDLVKQIHQVVTKKSQNSLCLTPPPSTTIPKKMETSSQFIQHNYAGDGDNYNIQAHTVNFNK